MNSRKNQDLKLPIKQAERPERSAFPKENSRLRSSLGFSLVELMISLVVSAVLMGALFTVCIRVQEMSASISTSVENRSNQHLAPLLLSQWIKAAGMNMFGNPEEYLAIRTGEIGIKADIRGDQGFPDGDTDDSFEDISFRASKEELKIRSGQGTFQPFLKGITGFEGSLDEDSLLTIKLLNGEDFLNSVGSGFTETRLMLWNTRVIFSRRCCLETAGFCAVTAVLVIFLMLASMNYVLLKTSSHIKTTQYTGTQMQSLLLAETGLAAARRILAAKEISEILVGQDGTGSISQENNPLNPLDPADARTIDFSSWENKNDDGFYRFSPASGQEYSSEYQTTALNLPFRTRMEWSGSEAWEQLRTDY